MAIRPLTLEVIQSGDALDQLNEEIALAAQDAIARYDLDKPRLVILEIAITPKVERAGAHGEMQNMPEIDWKVTKRLPGVRGMTTRASIRRTKDGSGLIVNTNDILNGDRAQADLLDTVEEATE